MVLSSEMKMLFYSCVLGLIQLLLAAAMTTKERGLQWNLSSRDKPTPPPSGIAGRLDRAFKNFMETFPFFIATTLIVQLTGMANATTTLGAHLYFWARLIYVPFYAFGIIGARTLIWVVSLVGLLMIFSALL